MFAITALLLERSQEKVRLVHVVYLFKVDQGWKKCIRPCHNLKHQVLLLNIFVKRNKKKKKHLKNYQYPIKFANSWNTCIPFISVRVCCPQPTLIVYISQIWGCSCYSLLQSFLKSLQYQQVTIIYMWTLNNTLHMTKNGVQDRQLLYYYCHY